MTIYDYNAQDEALKLTPPNKRKTNTLAWLSVFANKVQYLHDLFFNDYADGSNAAAWISLNPYVYLDRVVYIDNSVYECISPTGVTSATAPNADTANWIKVLDSFIGVRERTRYTGQKIVLEFILNRYFRVGGVSFPWSGANNTTQIYITKQNTNSSSLWMETSTVNRGESYMSVNSKNSDVWMDVTPSVFQPYSFIVNVPDAVKAAIEANIPTISSDTYETVVRSVVDKYARAGKLYQVTHYT